MYDVIVVGAGMVGLVAALKFAAANKRVALVEAKPPQFIPLQTPHARVVALNHTSEKLLQDVGVWDALAKHHCLSAYDKMFVWDNAGSGQIDFDAGCLPAAHLGHIVANHAIVQLAWEQIEKQGAQIQVFCPVQATAYEMINDKACLTLNDGQVLEAELIIGADGANSWLRDQAGISIRKTAYEQSAIVAVVECESSHQKTAWQAFSPEGPLAFLPLQNKKQCAIVWSTPDAESLLALEPADFHKRVARQIEGRLGAVHCMTKPVAIPLFERHAEHYVRPHLALVGDSAHTIHPLAGQGVNLGFQDVELLSELMLSQNNLGRYRTLRQYARTRRAANQQMMQAMLAFHKGFTRQDKWLVALRQALLSGVAKTPLVKNYFMRVACR